VCDFSPERRDGKGLSEVINKTKGLVTGTEHLKLTEGDFISVYHTIYYWKKPHKQLKAIFTLQYVNMHFLKGL